MCNHTVEYDVMSSRLKSLLLPLYYGNLTSSKNNISDISIAKKKI